MNERRIAELVGILRDAERELQALTGGQLDAVVAGQNGAYLLRESQERLRESESAQRELAATQLALINALPAHVALLDPDGAIVAVNDAWRRFAAEHGQSDAWAAIGVNHLAACEREGAEALGGGHAVAAGTRAVLAGTQPGFIAEYRSRVQGEERWFRVMVSRLRDDHPAGAVVMHVDITELKLADAALQESEARYRNTFEQAAVGIAHVGLDGRFLRVNGPFCAMVGYSNEELLSLTFFELTFPEDREEGRLAGQAMIAGVQQTYTAEKRYSTKNGDVIWVNLVSTLQHSASGAPEYFISVFHDVTARKVAELAAAELSRELKVEQARLLQAQTVAKVGSWETDLVTFAVAWSAETYRIFEVSPHEFTPTHQAFLALVHHADRTAVDEAFQASIEAQVPCTIEHRIKVPSGRTKYVEERWQTIRNEAGVPVRSIGTCQDVTERRLSTDQLRQNESLLRIAGRAARLGAWSLSWPQGKLTWSDETCAIHDLPAGHVPSLDEALSYYQSHGSDVVREHVERCGADGTPFEFELPIVTATGRQIWIRAIGEAVRDQAGRIIRLQGAIQDISEQHAAAERIYSLGVRLMNTLESITDAFFTVDGDWRFSYVNSETELLLERSRAQLLGLSVWDEFSESSAPEAFREFRRAVAEGASVAFEEFHARLDRWLEVRAFPSRDGLAVYFRDVTAIRDGREALRASEERFRLLARAANEAIWDWDIAANTLWWNEGYEALFGCDPAVSPSMAVWHERIHPDDLARVGDGIMAVVDSGLDVWSDEYRFLRADSSYAFVYDRGYVIRDTRGQAIRMVGAMTDLTERKRAEFQLAQTTRALQVLSRSNEALIRSEREGDLLSAVCRIAVDLGGFSLAWVGYAPDDDPSTIVRRAHADADVEAALDVELDPPPAARAAAIDAVQTAAPVVFAAAGVEPPDSAGFDTSHSSAPSAGVALPLASPDRTFGALVLCLAEPRSLSGEEIALLRELADNLAFGVGSLRARAEQRRMHEAVLTMARGVSTSTGTAFFDQLALSMVSALDADAGFVARLTNDGTVASTLCFVVGDTMAPNRDIDLSGTPCANPGVSDCWVVDHGTAVHEEPPPFLNELGMEAYVATLLPDSSGKAVGILFVMFRHSPGQHDFISSTLRIFAARAASELERMRADARLREQAELLDKAQDAIVVRDLQNRIVYWNRSAERLYGWTSAEVTGRTVEEVLYKDLSNFRVAMATLHAAGEWVGEIEQITKSGETRTVEGHWTLVRSDAGVPTSILAINTDITQRKRLEQQYLRAQRIESIGTLAGGIAHDLNNVLAPILMSVGLLQSDEDDPARLELLTTLEESAVRGADLVKQVLSFARGMDGQRVDVSALAVARDVTKLIRDTFPKDIEVVDRLGRDLWPIQADPTQLHQVLLNICVNARDAMPGGGRLTLSSANRVFDEHYAAMNLEAKAGPFVNIDIEDTGTGIPKSIIDKIFDPFFTTKDIGKGTGLGLATSLAIIKGHGGFIRVYSEPGRGTRFGIYLPATPDAVPDAAEAGQASTPRGQVGQAGDEANARNLRLPGHCGGRRLGGGVGLRAASVGHRSGADRYDDAGDGRRVDDPGAEAAQSARAHHCRERAGGGKRAGGAKGRCRQRAAQAVHCASAAPGRARCASRPGLMRRRPHSRLAS